MDEARDAVPGGGAVAILAARRPVVIAPHPDDEVLGCGGALAALVEAGAQPLVVILTDGGALVPPGMDRAQYVARRQAESLEAAAILGPYPVRFGAHPDQGLTYGEPLVEEIRQGLAQWGADLVLLPSPWEVHPDHRAAAAAGLEAARRYGAAAVACYEVSAPLPRVTSLVDITAHAARKAAAMAACASQMAQQDYAAQMEGLGRYRTYHAPAGVAAAEAYFVVPPSALGAEDPLGLRESEYRRQARLGWTAHAAAAPLVSVIVRSSDRPTLDAALDAVALQTHPRVEVLVVNAKGPGHRSLGEGCGRFPLRLVDCGRPLGRSQAANAGLQAATGDYVAFLDDDDLWEADHLARLVALAEGLGTVVYAGVRTLGRLPEEMVFHAPFDRVRLLAGNYIPLHALLIPRSLAQACPFDEGLDLYEDWDFLLHILQHIPSFGRLDAVTAIYRMSPGGGSGVHCDAERAAAALRRVRAKWQSRLVPRLAQDEILWNEFLERVRRLAELEEMHQAVGAQKDALIADLTAQRDALVAQQEVLVAQQEALRQELVAMRASRSWRLTAPLRRLGEAVRVLTRRDP